MLYWCVCESLLSVHGGGCVSRVHAGVIGYAPPHPSPPRHGHTSHMHTLFQITTLALGRVVIFCYIPRNLMAHALGLCFGGQAMGIANIEATSRTPLKVFGMKKS